MYFLYSKDDGTRNQNFRVSIIKSLIVRPLNSDFFFRHPCNLYISSSDSTKKKTYFTTLREYITYIIIMENIEILFSIRYIIFSINELRNQSFSLPLRLISIFLLWNKKYMVTIIDFLVVPLPGSCSLGG